MLFALALLALGATALPQPKNLQSTSPPAASGNSSNSPAHQDVGPRVCGTGPPSAALLDAHIGARQATLERRNNAGSAKISVDTVFHVVSSQKKANLVTQTMIADQVNAMNQAYAQANIGFNLKGTTFTVNDQWASDAQDQAMKQSLRQGTYSTLNIYFQTDLSDSSGNQLLGYCTMPTNVTYSPCAGCPLAEEPSADYYMDGCNVLASSMPKGPLNGYNMGKTAVHETGHWFGLLHTFSGSSCSPNDPGDYIDDTPQESVQTSGCPAQKDSCPGSPGQDPIHNYMDYSSDACYESFTPHQITRMHNMYSQLRYTR